MNLIHSLKWMLIGSIILGIYLNGMNMLVYRFDDLYFSSKTLIYSALFMTSNMCILKILISYEDSGKFNTGLLALFITASIVLVLMLRNQFLIDDNNWLKRMISHHSTALTTSHQIINRTKNEKIKKLATEIIATQEKEIKLMKSLLHL